MELTKEQILQIDNYISACGIKYYDVRMEIVDHFANLLEQKLENNPDLNFKKEIEDIHKKFSDSGFSRLLKEKTKSVINRFYKQSLSHLITFFKLPKIIISICLFFILNTILNYANDKELFFDIISIGLSICFVIHFTIILCKNSKQKNKFLVLERLGHYNIILLNIYHLFSFWTNYRDLESFLNTTYNSIQLAVFVVILLFFWSAESVFYQNKKLVKEQYPNILV